MPKSLPTRGLLTGKDSRGMTLLELMVVMVILGILATLGTTQVIGYLSRSQVDAAHLQMNQLATALDLFRLDLGRFPTDAEGLSALLTRPESGAEKWRGPYLTQSTATLDPWGQAYNYKVDGGQSFVLSSFGADSRQGGDGYDADLTYSRVKQ